MTDREEQRLLAEVAADLARQRRKLIAANFRGVASKLDPIIKSLDATLNN